MAGVGNSRLGQHRRPCGPQFKHDGERLGHALRWAALAPFQLADVMRPDTDCSSDVTL